MAAKAASNGPGTAPDGVGQWLGHMVGQRGLVHTLVVVCMYVPEWRGIRLLYFSLDERANCLDSSREHDVRAITQTLVANKTAPRTAHAATGTLAPWHGMRMDCHQVHGYFGIVCKVDTMGTQRGSDSFVVEGMENGLAFPFSRTPSRHIHSREAFLGLVLRM